MNHIQIVVMKRNKISTALSNIMLSPTLILFAIFLICSSHIFIKNGEARLHQHHPQQNTGRYINDFTINTEKDKEIDDNNDYDEDRDSTINSRYQQQQQQQQQQQTSLSPFIDGTTSNFVSSRFGLKSSQRYNRNNDNNNNHHQQFNPEQAISLASNSLRRLESTIEPLGLHKICPPNKPFQCPSDGLQGGECIPIQYLCNGFSDCPRLSNSQISSDEDPRLCAAIRRLQAQPVDKLKFETSASNLSMAKTNPLKTKLLHALIGVDDRPQYLGKLFVPRLFKRSGISDQRIAEIQMIRALKKQLERASNSSA